MARVTLDSLRSPLHAGLRHVLRPGDLVSIMESWPTEDLLLSLDVWRDEHHTREAPTRFRIVNVHSGGGRFRLRPHPLAARADVMQVGASLCPVPEEAAKRWPHLRAAARDLTAHVLERVVPWARGRAPQEDDGWWVHLFVDAADGTLIGDGRAVEGTTGRTRLEVQLTRPLTT